MIVDTSAVITMLGGNVGTAPSRASVKAALEDAELNGEASKISAPLMVELGMVMGSKFPGIDPWSVITALGIVAVSFDQPQARIALMAHERYGIRSGSKARLNMGDCMSYALAVHLGERLLFVGDDFIHTDVPQAIDRTAPRD